MDVWLALEQSVLGEVVRRSPFLYPAANVAHILGLLIFFSTVAVMDARLLGAFRQVPWPLLAKRCRPVAVIALVAQAGTGLLLLAPDAVAIAANPAFRLKLLTIAFGLANAALLEVVVRRRQPPDESGPPPERPLVQVCALLSLAAWLSTAALGRLIAYV